MKMQTKPSDKFEEKMASRLRDMETRKQPEKHTRLSALQIMVVGFAAVILLGALILMLPISNADGKWLSFLDALFTACTSVCVTGLVTVTPATQFTLFGKVIILMLIQIGGWGVIVCGIFFLVIIGRRVSVTMRMMIRDYFSMNTMSGIVRMLMYVVKASLVVELVGAAGYSIRFIPRFGLARGIWYSLFHSVSAFCNAGVDLLGANSLQSYAGDYWINFVTMFMIIMGGLGFAVWQNLTLYLKVKYQQDPGKCSRTPLHVLTLQTKLVLTQTCILLLGGAVLILFNEWNNPLTLGHMTFGQKLLAGFFQSVTTRTAGFASVAQGALRNSTKLLCCVLMFIGGSPAGTAGGIKTVTIAVLMLTCWSIARGHEDTEAFGRRIPRQIVRSALLVILCGLFLVLAGTFAVSALEPEVPLIDVLYEVTSAVATVGLTADLTPNLGTVSKCIIILLMYIGRIGPITLPMILGSRFKNSGRGRKLASEDVVVG